MRTGKEPPYITARDNEQGQSQWPYEIKAIYLNSVYMGRILPRHNNDASVHGLQQGKEGGLALAPRHWRIKAWRRRGKETTEI